MNIHHIEVEHAIETLGTEYGDECIVELASGMLLATPTYPKECDYVRVLTPKGYELMYWCVDEWEEDGSSVMGAIIGLLQSTPEDILQIEAEVEENLR